MTTIVNEFQRTVTTYPCNIALVSATEGEMSYLKLDEYSNFIAHELLLNKSEANVVGVFLNRSFALIASIIGVMKAGLTYLPLDPSYPIDRINWMLTTSKVKKIICDDLTKNKLNENYDILCLNNKYKYCDQNIRRCNENEIACILYTSGSTGRPNGVMMTHEAILNTLKWAIKFYELSTDDVALQVPSCSFTSSVQDIFSTLLSGGKLVILDDKKMLNARYLKMISDKYHVTHFDMVPSLYKEYLRIIKNESTLRFVLLAGEPLTPNLVRNHFRTLSAVRLVNEYGMAETCSCCFAKELTASDQIISIGKPIANICYKIMDVDPEGVGELLISGKGLSLGYHNNYEYTCEKYVDINGIRYLKTGDFVRKNEDGDIIYISRKDRQIKINGKRVNMIEIDYVLQNDEQTFDSITIAVLFREKQLIVSFVKSRKNDNEYYFEKLKEKLPVHCIPNYIKIIDDFYYLPNKKIDIKRMSEMVVSELDNANMLSDDRFKKISKIISEVSNGLLNEPNIDKDLRQQGIDSISFIRLLSEIEEQFKFEFGYDDIDSLKTVSIKTLYEYIIAISIKDR